MCCGKAATVLRQSRDNTYRPVKLVSGRMTSSRFGMTKCGSAAAHGGKPPAYRGSLSKKFQEAPPPLQKPLMPSPSGCIVLPFRSSHNDRRA